MLIFIMLNVEYSLLSYVIEVLIFLVLQILQQQWQQQQHQLQTVLQHL